MPVISNTVNMLFRAQDHASRVVGNINTSLSGQLTTFLQMGQKIPLVSRQVSTAMVMTTAATERYVRELKELKKWTELSTKDAIAYQHAIEQSGARYDTLVRFIDKVRDAQTKAWKIENQLLILRLKRYNLLDKEKGIMTDHNKILEKAAEHIMKYKEGYDRAIVAQKMFGTGGAALVPILEKVAEAQRLTKDRGEDFVKLMEMSEKQVEENRVVLSELTMGFKDFGVRVATIVLPVLTVMAKALSIMIDLLILLTRPLFAVLRVFAAWIAKVKEIIAVMGILGKIILWLAMFVLTFYIRKWLLAITVQIAAKVSAGALGASLKWLGGVIKFVGVNIINMIFWVQTMIVSTKAWILSNGGLIASLKIVSVHIGSLLWKMALLAVKILAVIAVAVIVYELFNKLAKIAAELNYQFARLFNDEQSNQMRRYRQEINSLQKDIDRWSVEGIWKRMQKGIGGANAEQKKLNANMKDGFGIARDMYDSLGDTLERAINLPANVLPPLMERMKANSDQLRAIDEASRQMRQVAEQSMSGAPTPGLDRHQVIRVDLNQKVEFGDMGEPVMKALEGAGI